MYILRYIVNTFSLFFSIQNQCWGSRSGSKGTASFFRIRIHNIFHGSGYRSRSRLWSKNSSLHPWLTPNLSLHLANEIIGTDRSATNRSITLFRSPAHLQECWQPGCRRWPPAQPGPGTACRSSSCSTHARTTLNTVVLASCNNLTPPLPSSKLVFLS